MRTLPRDASLPLSAAKAVKIRLDVQVISRPKHQAEMVVVGKDVATSLAAAINSQHLSPVN